jgi:hypothetical protein
MRQTTSSMLGILAFAIMGSACGPSLQVRTDFDRAVDFNQYRTFRLGESKQIPNGAAVMQNTLVKDRIDQALMARLVTEGLTPSTQGQPADLLVRYVAGARTKQELESVGWSGPYWGGPYYGDDLWVREYPEGTLVVDLVDARTSKLVWRAAIVAEGEGFTKAEFINKAIGKAFEKYPPRV